MDKFNKFPPIKKKYAGNQMPFITKESSTEMMTRWRLRDKYLNDKTEEKPFWHIQQGNNCFHFKDN